MLRAVVIGAGAIAKQHLGALQATPHAEAVGVCDLSPAMAESTAERFRIAEWGTDYRELLHKLRPDAVQVTTPASTHGAIARDCLDAGAHVLVEKPITASLEEYEQLAEHAVQSDRWLLEDHNYAFNRDVLRLLADRDAGRFGEIRHVEVQINLPLFAAGSRFADSDCPHPAMREPLGAVSDFLTHLSYLAIAFVGPHRAVKTLARHDSSAKASVIREFRAMIDAQHGSALLSLCTGSEIDGFWLRVEGSLRRAEVNLFEVGSVATSSLSGPQPLAPIRNMLGRAGAEFLNAPRSLSRKLSGGPGAYEGLWALVDAMYAQIAAGGEPPITPETTHATNALVAAITESGQRAANPQEASCVS